MTHSGSNTSGPYSDVAVVIPCHNEADNIVDVVQAFQRSLPGARILVVDNASTDGTSESAKRAGAEVLAESRIGKGFALIRGFNATRIERLVVMVDGDNTYSAEHAPMLVDAASSADLVIGTRLQSVQAGAMSTAHSFGNQLFIWMVRLLFGVRTTDLLSGYRVLSRRLLDALPLIATGFEVETEITLQALLHSYRVTELPAPYRARLGQNVSKVRTYRDGTRILLAMLAFFRDYRPLTCFGAISAGLLMCGLWAGSYPVVEYAKTGMVNRLPLAVLAVGLVLLSAITVISGLILSSVNRRAIELSAAIQRAGSRIGDGSIR